MIEVLEGLVGEAPKQLQIIVSFGGAGSFASALVEAIKVSENLKGGMPFPGH